VEEVQKVFQVLAAMLQQEDQAVVVEVTEILTLDHVEQLETLLLNPVI
jgi:hypothetical protein